MIHEWSKIRALFTFCLNVNEIQPPKYIWNIHDPILLIFALFLSFTCLLMYEIDLLNLLLVYKSLYFP